MDFGKNRNPEKTYRSGGHYSFYGGKGIERGAGGCGHGGGKFRFDYRVYDFPYEDYALYSL